MSETLCTKKHVNETRVTGLGIEGDGRTYQGVSRWIPSKTSYFVKHDVTKAQIDDRYTVKGDRLRAVVCIRGL